MNSIKSADEYLSWQRQYDLDSAKELDEMAERFAANGDNENAVICRAKAAMARGSADNA